MVVTLSENELRLVRTALVNYSVALRAEARPHCSGHSPEGITLCQRRLEVDALIDGLDSAQAGAHPVTKVHQFSAPEPRPYIVNGRAA